MSTVMRGVNDRYSYFVKKRTARYCWGDGIDDAICREWGCGVLDTKVLLVTVYECDPQTK